MAGTRSLDGVVMRRPLALLVIAALLTLAHAVSAAAARRDTSGTRTRLLLQWARDGLASPAIEDHQRALRALDEVLAKEPGNVEAWLTRGDAMMQAGSGTEARACYRRAIGLAPREPEGHLRLAMAWRREWLRVMGAANLDSAIASFDRALALRPASHEARMWLIPLLVETGDAARAMREAERAAELRPRRGEPALAVAYLAYRRGEIERADSLFRWAYDRLAPDLRARLDDLTPVAGAGLGAPTDSAPAPKRVADARRLWARLDPDPTTPANELRLELWSRVVHAWLLFDDPLRAGPDARAEVFVRYGPPDGVLLNPPGIPLFEVQDNPGLDQSRRLAAQYSSGSTVDPMYYPLDALALSYAELGMRVVLHDRGLQGRFTFPTDRDARFATEATPDRRLLAMRDDLLALGDGFAVFPTRPPRERRLDVSATFARFEAERGPRLFAQAGTPAAPGEALTAVWVVRDTSGRERFRQEQRLATSVCDPAGRRIAELSAPLPPGTYDVAVSVRDTHHKRGLQRVQVDLAAPPAGLALSDVVLTCGEPLLLVEGHSIRLEADTRAHASGGAPLVAYFELYRLATDASGHSSFEYEYTVRRLVEGDDGRRRPAGGRAALTSASASRVEVQVGAMRRQFVTVPTQSLERGRYALEIRVRDVASGAVVSRNVEFVRD